MYAVVIQRPDTCIQRGRMYDPLPLFKPYIFPALARVSGIK